MRKIELRKKGLYMLGGAAIALMSVFCKGIPALAATYGYFTVTGGVEGTDFDYNSTTKVLTIKSGKAMTIGGSNTVGDIGHILISGSSDVNVTISGLDIRRKEYPKNTPEAAIVIDDNYTGKATLTITGSNNKLSSSGKPAIQKNGSKSSLVLKGTGTLTAYVAGTSAANTTWPAVIGGEGGKNGENITIESGTYVLNSYSGGAVIGGGSSNTIGQGGDGKNIVINGGTITAKLAADGSNNYMGIYAGAVIGGGGNGDADGIYIHGGTIEADITQKDGTSFAGAVIGGGCNGNANNIVIDGGVKTKATVLGKYCGAAIGAGYKSVESGTGSWTPGNTITISGGYVIAAGTNYSSGIGGFGYKNLTTDVNYADNATVTITGGKVEATGGVDAPGIGGCSYSSSEVYISGGNVHAIKGTNAKSAIGLNTDTEKEIKSGVNVYTNIIKRSKTDTVNVSVQSKTESSVANSLVDLVITDPSGNAVSEDYYGTNDLKADKNGTVYAYLPSGYTLVSIGAAGKKTIDLSKLEWDYNDADPFYYDGNVHEVRLKSIPTGITVTYGEQCSGKDINPDSYVATATAESIDTDHYTTTGSIPYIFWNIKEYPMNPVITYDYNGTLSTTKAASYDDSVTLRAAGYYISDSINGPFNSEEYVVNKSGTVRLYFKNIETGYIKATPMSIALTINQLTPVDISNCRWNYTSPFIYDGKEHEVSLTNVPTGVDVAITGTRKASEKGTYTATASFTAQSGYKITGTFANATLNWEIKEEELIAADISACKWNYISPFTYDGTEHSVSVLNVPTGVNVTINGTDKATKSGEYIATAIITPMKGYKLTGSFADNTLVWKINKIYVDVSDCEWDYSGPYTYDGKKHTVGLKNVPSGVKYSISGTTEETKIGTYSATVTLTADDEYELIGTFSPVKLDWEIKKYSANPTITYNDSTDKQEVYNDDVVIKAHGYQINTNYTGTFKDSYVFVESGSANLYFKNVNTGYITTDPVKVEVTIERKTEVDISGLTWNYSTPFTYDGNEHRVFLTDIPEGVDVSYSGDIKKTGVGSYTTTALVSAKTGYKLVGALASSSCSWKIQEYAANPTITYNGSTELLPEYDSAVTIKADGFFIDTTPSGSFSSDEYNVSVSQTVGLYFKNKTNNYITTTPKNVSITINKLTPVDISACSWNYPGAFTYDGKNHEVSLNVPVGVNVSYTGKKQEKAIGTYSVTADITAADGYKLSGSFSDKTLAWEIKEYPSSGISVLYNGDALKTWYNTNVKITATGHKLRKNATDDFSNSITLTGSEDVALYFQSNEGYITTTALEKRINIDKNVPSGVIKLDGQNYDDINRSETVKTSHLKNHTASITGTDSESGIESIEYAVYQGTTVYTTAEDIEGAALSWKTKSSSSASVTFTAGMTGAIYAKITDKAGNVSYISTAVISDDNKAPVINSVSLYGATAESLKYNVSFNETCNYRYVLLNEADQEPASYSDIKKLSVNNEYSGEGTGNKISGTFTGLDANKGYVLYVAADDGQTSLSGEENPNVSAVENSGTVKTLQRYISVPNQKMSVKCGLSARTYTYDLKNMLNAAGVDVDSLGTISYEAEKQVGAIVSGDISLEGSILSIPVGNNFDSNLSQDIVVTFKFGNLTYKSAQAKLTITSVAKTPLTLGDSVTVSDKVYDGEAAQYSGNVQWVDDKGVQKKVSKTEITYSGKDFSGNDYNSTTPPCDAGSYSVTFRISDTDTEYTGIAIMNFAITRKDLTGDMNIKWLINEDEYDKDTTYYADGTVYTVTVTGYPNELIPQYTNNTGSFKGAYNTYVQYAVATGYNASNYVIPDNDSLAWTLAFYDNVPPAGKIVLNGLKTKTYDKINSTSAVIRIHDTSVNAKISGTDEHSEISSIEYAFADKVYTGSDAIEAAVLTWVKDTTCAFASDRNQVLYARIMDKPGNVTYVSTPVIYNDTAAPTVMKASLSNASETTLDYSFEMDEVANYHAVLLKSSEAAPVSIADIDAYINAGNPGKIGYNRSASGTIKELIPNQSYTLYVIADDGAVSMTGMANANASVVKCSSAAKTKPREINISDQFLNVKCGMSARIYNYDLMKLLDSTGVDQAELGGVTFTASKESGSIISGNVSVKDNVLSIPVGEGFSTDTQQTIKIEMTFGNTSFKAASTKLYVVSVSKNPLQLSGISISDKTYNGMPVIYNGSMKWKDNDDNYVVVGSIIMNYTGTTMNGKKYSSTEAPTQAGNYTLNISIPEDDENYTGSQSFNFTIFKKDLEELVKDVKWNINGQKYNPDKVYYTNDNYYTLTIDGYPSELVPEYNAECSAKEAGTYHAVAAYKMAQGYDDNNYIIPDTEQLAWTITEKQEIPVFDKITPDLSGVEWLYYKDDIECEDDSSFVEDGSTYRVLLDKYSLPEGIDGNNIKYISASGDKGGEYTTTARLSVTDEERFNVPDDITLIWTIRKSENDDPVVITKQDIDMSDCVWNYINGSTKGVYSKDVLLTENGLPYSVEISNLPDGVSVDEYSTEKMIEQLAGIAIPEDKQTGVSTDNKQTAAGLYKTTVTFKVEDAEHYNVPASMSITWRISEKAASASPDNPPAAGTTDPVVPAVESETVSEGRYYKVLSSSPQGGTVEYEGEEVINKKVTKISIPEAVVIEGQVYTVTSIKSGSLSSYKKLKSVTIPKTIENIGDKAFYNCASLKSVVIPSNVTVIGNNAFAGCKKLSKITIKSKVLKKVGKNAIKGINKKATIKCPSKKLVKKYKKLFKSKTGYKKTMKIK